MMMVMRIVRRWSGLDQGAVNGDFVSCTHRRMIESDGKALNHEKEEIWAHKWGTLLLVDCSKVLFHPCEFLSPLH